MRRLTKKEEFNLYQLCVMQGVELNCGKLSLCDLANHKHSQVKNNRRWQIHCDDKRFPWSMIYPELEQAISKFMEIKDHLCIS